MDKKSLGKRINIARKEKHLTSEKLAERCNINATYLRQIESGSKIPSLPVFVAICQNLNVSPTYLLMDSIEIKENKNIDKLLELLQTATPNQTKLIVAMLESALKVLGDM